MDFSPPPIFISSNFLTFKIFFNQQATYFGEKIEKIWNDPAISGVFLRSFLVAHRSNRANVDFGRMPVKSTIWSHDGQKDRFVIFGLEASKWVKNP